MITLDELRKFIEENVADVVARNWYNDIMRTTVAEAKNHRLSDGLRLIASGEIDDPKYYAEVLLTLG